MPFQANYDFGMGPTDDGYQFKLNFQPVVPVSISKDWNLIVRIILPVISQHDLFYSEIPEFPVLPPPKPLRMPQPRPTPRPIQSGRLKPRPIRPPRAYKTTMELYEELRDLYDDINKDYPQNRSQDGLGDTTMSFFLSPKEPGPGGVVWGVGPAFLLPTATHPYLGSGEWGAGPTGVALVQKAGWTAGMLANHIWSFAGEEDRRSVCASFVQPFLSYTTKTHTTFSLNSESSYDWDYSQWTVPINLMISQVLKFGRQPLSVQLGGRYYAEGPSGAPEWGVRLAVTLLYPTGKNPAPGGGKSFVK